METELGPTMVSHKGGAGGRFQFDFKNCTVITVYAGRCTSIARPVSSFGAACNLSFIFLNCPIFCRVPTSGLRPIFTVETAVSEVFNFWDLGTQMSRETIH